MGSDDVEKLRINRAFWLSIGGIGLVVLLICILVFGAGWSDASDIASVVGLLTSLIGTIVGAFFGLQIGASGRQAAERRAEQAEKKVEALSAVTDTDAYAKARSLYPDPWE